MNSSFVLSESRGVTRRYGNVNNSLHFRKRFRKMVTYLTTLIVVLRREETFF